MFQRVGSAAYKEGLDTIINLCNRLGNPQDNIPFVHVAGTNGKGSVSHYLASILQSCDISKVGLHTSPHSKDFRERIKINGNPVPEDYVIGFVNEYRELIEELNPSFFELSVAMTFHYFNHEKVDIAVIETGLGGRLDSTNIILPLVSIITNISYDHTALLGDTLEKIAGEKAGIIKAGVQVVIGERQTETDAVFKSKAKDLKAQITFASDIYSIENARIIEQPGKTYLSMDIKKNGKQVFHSLLSELTGLYQLKNIPTVLSGVEVLKRKGYLLNNAGIREGIANVISQTGIMGRWQTLSHLPLVIADTGHNEAGIKEVLKNIEATPHNHLHFVFGTVSDKDITGMLKQLPIEATYYFCRANIPRSLDELELQKKAKAFGLKGERYSSVPAALEAAKFNALKNDLIVVGGSTFVVAEVV